MKNQWVSFTYLYSCKEIVIRIKLLKYNARFVVPTALLVKNSVFKNDDVSDELVESSLNYIKKTMSRLTI